LQILFLGLAPPIPTTNGHRMRCCTILSALAAEGHQVTLVCFADSNELRPPTPQLTNFCAQVHFVPAPPEQPSAVEYWNRLRGLLSAMPFGAQRLHSGEMSDTVQRTLGGGRFDAIICDDVYMLANIPPQINMPVFLNKHDITHEIMGRFLDYERNPLKRLYGRSEYAKVRGLEIDACTDSDAVLACSERDGQEIRKFCPAARTYVLPNVVDVWSFQPAYEDDGRTVLYVGAMDWFPNRDAVDYFAEEILPRLRQKVSNLDFVVAGRNPSQKMRDRYRGFPDVTFTGSVAEMRPIIAKAAVCVVPLRIGSGTRLKILQAAAMGKAIVSTRLGAEGLEFVPGEEIILADEPKEFAARVADLLADQSRRVALGGAARRRVELHYDLSTLRTAVRTAFEQIVPQVAKVAGR
jgi:glycosyltransferase involved in cell wall biosynthesis